MILFVLPNPDTPSGGNIYNRRMLEQVQREGMPITPIAVSGDVGPEEIRDLLASASGDLVIWDSLLMDCLPSLHGGLDCRFNVLLMHYLPSRNPLSNPEQRQAARSMEDQAAGCVSAFIATGAGVAGELRRRYPDRDVHVCEPGIDACFRQAAPSRRSRSEGPLQILTVANLLPGKGLPHTLNALAQLSELNWVWHIVGDAVVDPGHGAFLRARAERLELRDRVIFHGSIAPHRLAELMAQVDLFVSSSLEEAFGMAMAEAVAAGLPVVGTRVGEAARLVSHGRSGWLSEVGEWGEFQRHLELAVRDGKARTTMGQEALGLPVRHWADAGREFAMICRDLLGVI